jgi:hypothetical protein
LTTNNHHLIMTTGLNLKNGQSIDYPNDQKHHLIRKRGIRSFDFTKAQPIPSHAYPPNHLHRIP